MFLSNSVTLPILVGSHPLGPPSLIFFEYLWVPSCALIMGLVYTGTDAEALVVSAGAISTFSSTFWVGAMLLYSGLTGNRISNQVSGGTSRAAFDVRAGGFWVQAIVLTLLFGFAIAKKIETSIG